jgi:curved DNA-binding protein CbpA
MRNVRRDLYQILEVDSQAGIDQIKRAYRRLARRYHPDINPSPNAKGRMQAINQAYEVLGDPVKRARYDRWRLLMQGSWTTYASPRPLTRLDLTDRQGKNSSGNLHRVAKVISNRLPITTLGGNIHLLRGALSIGPHLDNAGDLGKDLRVAGCGYLFRH